MTLDEAHRRVEQLRHELEEHEYRYYVLSAPTISDRDFDGALLRSSRDAGLIRKIRMTLQS